MSYEIIVKWVKVLEQWLAELDYINGLRIYQDLWGETILYKMLVSHRNSFNQTKLEKVLREELDRLRGQSKTIERNEPKQIIDERERSRALMNERAMLKAQLAVMDDVNERKARAFRILDITDELDSIYGKITFFEKNNVVFEEQEESVSDEDLIRRYLNLGTYISRTKKTVELEILSSKKDKMILKLKNWELEYAELKLNEIIKKTFN
jgi:hypothetical protein